MLSRFLEGYDFAALRSLRYTDNPSSHASEMPSALEVEAFRPSNGGRSAPIRRIIEQTRCILFTGFLSEARKANHGNFIIRNIRNL